MAMFEINWTVKAIKLYRFYEKEEEEKRTSLVITWTVLVNFFDDSVKIFFSQTRVQLGNDLAKLAWKLKKTLYIITSFKINSFNVTSFNVTSFKITSFNVTSFRTGMHSIWLNNWKSDLQSQKLCSFCLFLW